MNEVNDISLTIKFFANLRELGPAKSIDKFPKGTTVRNVLDKYQIPYIDMKLIILINGKPHTPLDHLLHDGDILAVFPPLAGG